ncbi:hypothetical protein H0H92_012880 [Tricholoma furcatifolium]|nr:hypothetical protein H0H92_012880 [Tricholoma furcatifolium]
MAKVYKGTCFCRSVSYQVSGPPVLTAYCHCTNCQRLAGAPFIHTLHFPAEVFKFTNNQPDEDLLDTFVPPEKSYKTRYRCKKCGAPVASKNGLTKRFSILGTHLERDAQGTLIHFDELKPTAHIYYDTRVLDINDELGKWYGYENESERLK